jgi:hypothetical protein
MRRDLNFEAGRLLMSTVSMTVPVLQKQPADPGTWLSLQKPSILALILNFNSPSLVDVAVRCCPIAKRASGSGNREGRNLGAKTSHRKKFQLQTFFIATAILDINTTATRLDHSQFKMRIETWYVALNSPSERLQLTNCVSSFCSSEFACLRPSQIIAKPRRAGIPV